MSPSLRVLASTVLILFNAPTWASGPAGAALDRSLACIEASDDQYNAVIALNVPEARAAAVKIDGALADAGLLAGMPVLLKDNIETRDLPTTAGSLALADNRTGRDAPLVAQLRESGAIVLGKTNLSEWANFRSEHSSSGWSAVGGQTKNAVDPARTPCGSSSGSAVAVARGYVPMAVGTETSGSIVCPATVNGVVGFKPTQGLIAGTGIVPLASTQDTAGPIADSVATAARTLAVMANAERTEAAPAIEGLVDYDALVSLQDQRIGVLARVLGFDKRRDAELEAVLVSLRADGAEIVDGLTIDYYDAFGDDSYQVLLYEFRRDLADYFGTLSGPLTSLDLAALVEFNSAHAEAELNVFDQSIFLRALALKDTEEDYRARLLRIRQATRADGLDRLFAQHKLDAIIGITDGPAWMIDHVNGDAFFGPGMARDAAIAGNPHITLPLAQVEGLPVGISLLGERWADHRLAQIAFRLESIHPRPRYAWSVSTPAETSASCSGWSDAP